MGLFQKKIHSDVKHAPLYTIGGQQTLLIVGLGNPGDSYAGTRHNAGFDCLNAFVAGHDEFGQWVTKKDLSCDIVSGIFGGTRVIVIKPTTFMNDSGRAVQAVQSFYKIANAQTIVVHDELALPYGQIRTSIGGSSAGHNGIKSLISHCGEDFGRVRIGIDNPDKPNGDTKDFVLKPFNSSEKAHNSALLRETESILIESVFQHKLSTETRSFIIG
jgi:PTH1 family peptidyl-tRNA hydrolase